MVKERYRIASAATRAAVTFACLLVLVATACTPVDRGAQSEEARSAPPRPTPSPRSDPPPVEVPDDAVRLEVGDDFQEIVEESPPGSTFVIASGVHRRQQVIPRDDDRFVGESGAVLKGSRVLTEFERERDLYVASGQDQQNEVGQDQYMEEGRERDVYPEELFFDGHRLRHVGSPDEVEPGSWHFDYAGDRIYMADDPAGALVETSVTQFAFGGTASDVTLENISVQHYANRAQLGAIHGEDTVGWTIRSVDSSYNHGSGIHLGPGWSVSHSRFTYNGQIGMNADGKLRERQPIVVRNSELAQNKQLGYEWTWEGGAAKFARTVGMVFEHNWVHDNIGPGPWFDIDNVDAVIRSNLVEGNSALGIHYEISYGAQIYWNEVRDNGVDNDDYGSGVFISNSSNVEVFENLLYANRNEVFALQDDRGEGEFGPRTVADLYVHDNQMTVSDGQVGLRVRTGEDEYYASRGVRFEDNVYRVEDLDAPAFYWNETPIDAEQWRSAGLDVDGDFLEDDDRGQLPADAEAFTAQMYGSR